MSVETGFEGEPRRYFGGKLDGFESRQESNIEKKHLQAYLRGEKEFHYGSRFTVHGKIDAWYKVQEIWK